jgi:hypothetical protein
LAGNYVGHTWREEEGDAALCRHRVATDTHTFSSSFSLLRWEKRTRTEAAAAESDGERKCRRRCRRSSCPPSFARGILKFNEPPRRLRSSAGGAKEVRSIVLARLPLPPLNS